MSQLDNAYGIIPPSGEYEKDWPVHFNIPQGASGGISTGGWTADNLDSGNFGNEGFVQQTFLGASILNFDLSAGFGDSASSMNINLINDEFNKSDGIGFGDGDDPYHNGQYDEFLPPVVGSPVFFKFGKNPATVEQAFRQTFDDLYGIKTLPDKIANNAWGIQFPTYTWDANNFNELPSFHLVDRDAGLVQDRSALWNIDTIWRGRAHFNFGGILQSYTQNKGPGGKPTYSVQLTDPREILSNVAVLLNNYQGTTFNNKNLINLYGFLEYDPSPSLLSKLSGSATSIGIINKFVDRAGNTQYIGVKSYWDGSKWQKTRDIANVVLDGNVVNLQDQYFTPETTSSSITGDDIAPFFPITGQGFSRRSDQGMPFYRISQGLAAIFQYYGFLPQEYKDAGFGGAINFRGFNYVVDFGGIPTNKIPLLYYMDFDQIDLLSLAQELCDIISHELYVTLLPVIDHPSCEFLYKYNTYEVQQGNPENIIAGIIRLDAIDKTKQPKYGAIKSYLDNLESRGISVENQDIGFELSNVTTDKFVVGSQEVDMYFFSTERDRDELWTSNQENASENMEWLRQFQWDLRTQQQQQVLPYYGLLGDKAISIPRGFGSYQQILLDAKSLNAYGVGNYYVATELELRAALVSYEKWKDFLLSYNETYIEDISEHRAFLNALSSESDQASRVINQFKEDAKFDDIEDGPAKRIIEDTLNKLKNRQYAATVPRCVWHSDKPFVTEDGYPASPCSPPFGYPLYYRRATSIGIVEAGIGKIVNAKTQLVKDITNLQKSYENINSPQLDVPKDQLFKNIKNIRKKINDLVKDNPNFDKNNNPKYQSLIKQLRDYTIVFDHYDQMKANLEASNKAIAFVESLEDGPLGKFLYNIEKTAKKHEENAKKVYDFVKSIAEECLGKKFLVRIPKTCNLGYSQTISTFTKSSPFNVQNGPFGFPPKPISSDPNIINGVYYDINNLGASTLANSLRALNYTLNNNFKNLWQHYLQDYKSDKSFGSRRTVDDSYSFGALKGNFNPFTESWEWNYKPEPQGGFFGFNIFGVNISALEALKLGIPWDAMPPVIQQGLCPLDMTNLLSDSNRVQCYVRYNHSQTLDFTGVNSDDIIQQVMSKGGQFIPDIVQELPNNNLDEKTSFNMSLEDFASPPSMAFVKCNLDEKLYLAPKLQEYSLTQFGREYEYTLSIPVPQIVDIQDENGCPTTKVVYPELAPVFSIPRDGGIDGTANNWVDFARTYDDDVSAWIINTSIEDLDSDHVYALITVPGRIKSLIDTRWNDGQNQAFNAMQLKHLMTQDTVQIPEFNKPNIPVPGKSSLLCGPPPVFKINDYTDDVLTVDEDERFFLASADADKEAKKYGLIGSSLVIGEFGLDIFEIGFIPGKKEDWLQLSLEEISSARAIAKKVIQGSISNNPNYRLHYTQPSPVYPDIVALPLMSMERCYGPWMSASQLNPESDPRIKYSDIGGKVEFVKEENLAPWNYAGYQLMNEAGSLQANFSNSLLLFSERGGFVFPDAPTGIALARALQAEGPLVTSISINVSDAGVKTTVKLDLYTAQWGKLAKQKEMAISQIARERQKLQDQQNSAIRRGLGKRATSADLVNTVMNAGGSQILNMITSITSQMDTNKELGKKISEGVVAIGPDGGVAYNDPADIRRAYSTNDFNLYRKELDTHVIEPAANLWQAFANGPHSALPSREFNPIRAMQWVINPDSHKE